LTAAAMLAGYGADLLVGDPARRHPVAGFGAVARAIEPRVYRPRRAAGVLYAGGLVTGAGGAAALADRLAGRVRGGRFALTAAAIWSVLGGRSLAREGRAMAALLRGGELDAARVRARALVGRDPSSLGAEELSRAAIESIAENTADAVVGPLVWCAAAGPAGAVAYRAANTLDAIVGHRSPRYERFGWAAARLDDALGWPGARMGAVLAVALAPAVGGSSGAAWRALRRDGSRHPSPNAGRLEAAFAGALGVRLGGRNVYDGRVEERPALGDGRAPGPADIERAARLSVLVGAAAAAGAAGVLVLAGRSRA
jgi:adenosylcobinamide-phosphate synthase